MADQNINFEDGFKALEQAKKENCGYVLAVFSENKQSVILDGVYENELANLILALLASSKTLENAVDSYRVTMRGGYKA